MKKTEFRLLAFFLSAVMIMMVIPGVKTYAYVHTNAENMTLIREDGATYTVKTLHYGYSNNRYVSVRDMAGALRGTSKEFSVRISGSEIALRRGESYTPAGGENNGFVFPEEKPEEDLPEEMPSEITAGDDLPEMTEDPEAGTDEGTAGEEGAPALPPEPESFSYTTGAFRLNTLTIDDRKCKYHTFTGANTAGVSDAYFSITDLAMILNADLEIRPGGELYFYDRDLVINMEDYIAQGFYQEVYGALVGNADTGEIYSEWCADLSVPCASTTKLMTYLCVMDAISTGEIGRNDTVVISENAEKLSHTSDGVVQFQKGQTVSLNDLLYALLLPSSNESALALAEHIDGSEDAFVQRMNDTARKLGLSDATFFYNCHGLPEFSDTLAASKIQNHISARDMFRLVCHILSVYPQITDITSRTEYDAPTLNRKLKNTNPLLYNMPGIVGLKTGTTRASGASLVSAYRLEDENVSGTIVAVEFGAEDAVVRCTLSEVLIRYGIQCARGEEIPKEEKTSSGEVPRTAEDLVRRILKAKRGE